MKPAIINKIAEKENTACQNTINFKICHVGGHVPPQWHLEKKNSGEQRQSRLRSWFSSKRDIMGDRLA